MCDAAEPVNGATWPFGPDRDRSRRADSGAGLATPRLLLRQWRDSDLDAAAELNADPDVMAHMPAPLDRAASDALVARLRRQRAAFGHTLWVIEVRDSVRGPTSFAGFAGLQPVSFEPPFRCPQPCLEVGWRLLPRWWGLGIATEAGRASLSFGFQRLGVPEIVAFTVVGNERSRGVMRRLGMVPDVEFDHPRAPPADWWRRHVLYRARPERLDAAPGPGS